MTDNPNDQADGSSPGLNAHANAESAEPAQATSSAAPIRQLPAQKPRVETGPVEFEGDWPGVFIRGDNAAWLGMALREVAQSEAMAHLGPLQALPIFELVRLLGSALIGPAAGLPQLKPHFDCLPQSGEYFRHVDGGYYRKLKDATHTNDLSPVVVYEHVWPFERRTWVRPALEWDSRFKPVLLEEVRAAMAKPQQQEQESIQRAKEARREQESKRAQGRAS